LGVWWKEFRPEDLGQWSSSFDSGILKKLIDEMAMTELQGFPNDAANIVSRVVIAAHFIELFNGLIISFVLEDGSDSIA
jgi:hypothetical protein